MLAYIPAPWILWVWDKPLGGLAITRPVPKWDDPGKKISGLDREAMKKSMTHAPPLSRCSEARVCFTVDSS